MDTTRRKKRALAGGITAKLLGAFLLGGIALGNAGWVSAAPPSTPGTPSVSTAGTHDTSSGTEPVETNDDEGTPQPPIDPSQAKITVDQAKQTALGQYPGATVKQTYLEREHGVLVWDVELVDASGKSWDVKVDANSGQIVTTSDEGREQPEKDGDPDREGAEGAEGD